MIETLKWHNEKRKVKNLIPYEYNPRQMTEKQAKLLTDSLKKFDLVEIPAIDTDNKIIAGHMRMKIMLELGRGDEEVDVRVPNRKLTEREFQEYNLRSNKNVGDWDFDILANFEDELLKEVGFEGVSADEFNNNNKEVDTDEMSTSYEVKLKLNEEEYERFLSNIAKAQAKLDLESNEQVILHLLDHA